MCMCKEHNRYVYMHIIAILHFAWTVSFLLFAWLHQPKLFFQALNRWKPFCGSHNICELHLWQWLTHNLCNWNTSNHNVICMNCDKEDTNTIPQHAVTSSSDLTFQNCSILIWILRHKLNQQVVLHQLVLSASVTIMAEYTQATYMNWWCNHKQSNEPFLSIKLEVCICPV